MRNILSYTPETKFSGREILDWAKHQVENETSHKKQGAIILRRFSNLKPDKMYLVRSQYQGENNRGRVRHPLVINAGTVLRKTINWSLRDWDW
jgi:hypothetical protein